MFISNPMISLNHSCSIVCSALNWNLNFIHPTRQPRNVCFFLHKWVMSCNLQKWTFFILSSVHLLVSWWANLLYLPSLFLMCAFLGIWWHDGLLLRSLYCTYFTSSQLLEPTMTPVMKTSEVATAENYDLCDFLGMLTAKNRFMVWIFGRYFLSWKWK